MCFGPASPDAGVELLRQLFLQCAKVCLRKTSRAQVHLCGAQAELTKELPFPAFFTSVELVRYDYISHVELFR